MIALIEKSEKVYGAPNSTSSMRAFDDQNEYAKQKLTFPTAVIIKTGGIVDSICLKYAEGTLPLHGGMGGGGQEFKLAADEHIIKVTGSFGNFAGKTTIDSLIIHTDKSRTYGSRNIQSSGNAFEYTVAPNCALCCLYGNEEIHPGGLVSVSQLGFYECLIKKPDLNLGKGGSFSAPDFKNLGK